MSKPIRYLFFLLVSIGIFLISPSLSHDWYTFAQECNNSGVKIEGVELKVAGGYIPEDFDIGYIDFWVNIYNPTDNTTSWITGFNSTRDNLDYPGVLISTGQDLSCGDQCIKSFCVDGSQFKHSQVSISPYEDANFIKGLRRISKSNYHNPPTDTEGEIKLIQGTLPALMNKGQSLGKIIYEWTPIGVIGQPEVPDINPKTINKTQGPQDITVKINLLSQDKGRLFNVYQVSITNKTGTNFTGLTLVCTEANNRLDPKCIVQSVVPGPGVVEIENANLNGHELSFTIKNAHTMGSGSYLVNVRTDRYTKMVNSEFTVSENFLNDVEVKIEPSTLKPEQTLGYPINVTLDRGTTEKFSVYLDRSAALISSPLANFSCSGNGCSTSFNLPKEGLKPSTYSVDVFDEKNNKRGSAPLLIEGEIVSSGKGLGNECTPACKSNEECRLGKCIPKSIAGGLEVSGCSDKDSENPGIATAIGCIHTNPAALVKDLLTFIIGIAGGLSFLMMLLGVFGMLTSAGNPDSLNAGRERLTNAVIGLLFVIFAVLLLQIIGVGILDIPGFK